MSNYTPSEARRIAQKYNWKLAQLSSACAQLKMLQHEGFAPTLFGHKDFFDELEKNMREAIKNKRDELIAEVKARE